MGETVKARRDAVVEHLVRGRVWAKDKARSAPTGGKVYADGDPVTTLSGSAGVSGWGKPLPRSVK